MNKDEYLRIVRKQIAYVFDRDKIARELDEHLYDSIQDLKEEGLSEEEAEAQAVKQMGDPVETGRMLNREHHPLIGYLFVLSNIVLVLLAIPVSSWLMNLGLSLIWCVKPVTIDNSVETMAVNMEVDMPTHKLKLDNICINEDGEYYLTYRAWTKYDYSRAGWKIDLFSIRDSQEDYMHGSSYWSAAFLGGYGYKEFERPEDDLLYIVTRDDQTIEIDLRECLDEKK